MAGEDGAGEDGAVDEPPRVVAGVPDAAEAPGGADVPGVTVPLPAQPASASIVTRPVTAAPSQVRRVPGTAAPSSAW